MTITSLNISDMHIEQVTDNHDLYPNGEKAASPVWEKRSSYSLIGILDEVFSKIEDKSVVLEDLEVNPEAYRVEEGSVVVIDCPDGRLNKVDFQKIFHQLKGKPIQIVRIPGSTIGFTGAQMGAIAQGYKANGAPDVYATSHQDCGAAKAEAEAKGIEDSELYAQQVVEDLEKTSGIKYLGYITADDEPELLKRHSELALLVDMTGRRNQIPDGQLPEESFVLTASVYKNAELLESHIKILTGIALGHHGVGVAHDGSEGFSKEHPFYVFVSADNDGDLRKTISEAEASIKDLPDAVRIAGFIVPKE